MSIIRRMIPTSGKVAWGLIIVLFFVAIAVFGPLIAEHPPRQTGNPPLSPPSREHWFGTTQVGQDVFAQFVHGARVSLLIGFVAGALSQLISVLVGLVGGYFRGWADDFFYILTAVFLVLPGMPLLIVLTGYLPTRGMISVAIVITITSWAASARVLRAQTLSLRARDFVESARAAGESRLRILFAEVMPNALPVVASGFLFSTIAAILAEAGLSFLGLGSLTTVSWGTMLYFAQQSQALLSGAWWWFVPPGLAIAIIGAGLALINFGIDEFANPRLRTGSSRAKVASSSKLRATTFSSTTAAAEAGALESGGQVSSMVSRQFGTGPGTDDTGMDQTIVSSASAAEVAPQLRPVNDDRAPVISVRDLIVDYPLAEGTVRAVNSVSLNLHRGEILGLCGESGSGKSTLTNAITRLLRGPAEVIAGEITYHRGTARSGEVDRGDVDLLSVNESELRALRWQEIAVVFQSAMNALNPVTSIGAQCDDVLRIHRPAMSSAERRAKAKQMLHKVGIPPERITAYPHELSGGMKQRVAIAISLVLDPEVIIMDEPTTALDVLIQREVLDQVLQLRDELDFAIIFTTHDLALLLEISDSIAVMQQGVLVEYGEATEVYRDPRHPYTQALLESLSDLGANI